MIWNVILKIQVKGNGSLQQQKTRNNILKKERKKKKQQDSQESQAATVSEVLKHHLSPNCVQQQKQLKSAAAI